MPSIFFIVGGGTVLNGSLKGRYTQGTAVHCNRTESDQLDVVQPNCVCHSPFLLFLIYRSKKNLMDAEPFAAPKIDGPSRRNPIRSVQFISS